MTEQQMREINATACERLARANGIPMYEASAWLALAATAFRRRADVPDYRDNKQSKGVKTA